MRIPLIEFLGFESLSSMAGQSCKSREHVCTFLSCYGELYYLLSDPLGSTTVTLNLDGGVESEMCYSACSFGSASLRFARERYATPPAQPQPTCSILDRSTHQRWDCTSITPAGTLHLARHAHSATGQSAGRSYRKIPGKG